MPYLCRNWPLSPPNRLTLRITNYVFFNLLHLTYVDKDFDFKQQHRRLVILEIASCRSLNAQTFLGDTFLSNFKFNMSPHGKSYQKISSVLEGGMTEGIFHQQDVGVFKNQMPPEIWAFLLQ